jgi:hypothetical protein
MMADQDKLLAKAARRKKARRRSRGPYRKSRTVKEPSTG